MRIPLLLTFVLALPVHAADTLDARLVALEDRAAIETLVTGAYPRALDGRHWADYAALFTSDAQLTMQSQTLKGSAAIEQYFRNVRLPGIAPPRPGEVRALHIVTNVSYKLDGDTASGGAYWQTIAVTDGHTAVLSAGHYEDLLRKVDGRWKFAKRVIASDLAPPPANR